MSSQQKKYTALSAIFAVPAPVCIAAAISFLSESIAEMTAEGPAAALAHVARLIMTDISYTLIAVAGIALCGIFAIISYIYAKKAMRAEAEGAPKAILARVINLITILELAFFALFITALTVYSTWITVMAIGRS